MKLCGLKTSVLVLMMSGVVSTAWANTSVDYTAVGGLKPVYQIGLSLQSADISLSKKQVRTVYQIKNSTKKALTETLVLPLPKVASYGDTHADTGKVIGSLNITVDGKTVKPNSSVRAYLHPLKADGKLDKLKYLDVTTEFKSCGFSQSELMNPWTQAYNTSKLAKRLQECKNDTIQKLIQPYEKNDTEIQWFADVTYSWKQNFKANAQTEIKQSFSPAIGRGDAVGEHTLKVSCADANFKTLMAKSTAKTGSALPPYSELVYWNGVQSRQAIPEFRLTVERDADEIVTFCWDGETKKIADNRFEMKKQNFILTQPLGILFVKMKK